jgi:hypothetical protein
MIKPIFNFKFFIVAAVLATLHIPAQSPIKWKKYFLLGSSQLVSGMLDGTIESVSFRYHNGFKKRFPKANDLFWNPEISWKNKYKEGNSELGPKFIGSNTIFVFTTDAYHLLRTSKRTVDGLTLAYYANDFRQNKSTVEMTVAERKKYRRSKVMGVTRDFLLMTVIRSAGFHLTYSVAFKKEGDLKYF